METVIGDGNVEGESSGEESDQDSDADNEESDGGDDSDEESDSMVTEGTGNAKQMNIVKVSLLVFSCFID
jgi:hypothetical protein